MLTLYELEILAKCSFKVYTNALVQTQSERFFSGRNNFLRHLLRLKAYNFVINSSCDVKFCRIAAELLQFFYAKENTRFRSWEV